MTDTEAQESEPAESDSPLEPVPAPEPAPPQPPPPAEAESDAIESLEDIDRAQGFGPASEVSDPLAMADPLGVGGPAPLWQPAPIPAPAPPPVVAAPTSIARTLEDLYARHSEVGDGAKFLRVIRKSPKVQDGYKIAGHIADVEEQLSLPEFGARFGGGVYEVLVMGPGRSLDDTGRYTPQTLDRTSVEIAGRPVARQAEDQEMTGRPLDYPGPTREVELQRMKFEQENRVRAEARNDRWIKTAVERPDVTKDLFGQIAEASEQRAADVRVGMMEALEALKRENVKLTEQRDRRDNEIQELRQRMLQVQEEAARQVRDKESTRVTELKDRYESDLTRIKTEQVSSLEGLAKQHSERVREMTDVHGREREQNTQTATAERERLREDARRREQQLVDDARLRESTTRENFESRIRELERSSDREIGNVKDQRDREISVVQSTTATNVTLTEKAADFQRQALESQLTMLTVELEGHRRENEDMRMKINKTPQEAIGEAKELMDIVGGGKGEEGEFDWKKGAFQFLSEAAKRIPEGMQSLGQARANNQAGREVAQARARAAEVHRRRAAAAQPAQPSAMQLQAPNAAPSARGYPPTDLPGHSAPSWGDAQGVPLAPGDAVGPPAPAGPMGPMSQAPQAQAPMGSKDQVRTPDPPPVSGSEPTGAGMVPGFMAAPEPDPPPPAPPEVQAEVQPEAAPAPDPGADLPELTQEAVKEFTDKLELAISMDSSPTEFAASAIEEMGVPLAAQIIGSVEPDQLADAIAAHEEGDKTQIVTYKGREFLRALWEEARRLIAEAQA